jgi:hypothetical protein
MTCPVLEDVALAESHIVDPAGIAEHIQRVGGTRVIEAAQAGVATPRPNEARIVMTVRTGVA